MSSSPQTHLIQTPGGGGTPASLGDWMGYADSLRRVKQLERLGKMKVIVLEAAQGVNAPGRNVTDKLGLRMEWTNHAAPSGRGTLEFYIPLAQSLDKRYLVLEAPLLDEQGRPGLPRIPDPQFKRQPMSIDDYKRANTPLEIEQMTPQQRKVHQETGRPIYPDAYQSADEPTLLEQPLAQRTRGSIAGFPHLWVFGPVHQILFQPELGDKGLLADYWTVEGMAAPGGDVSTFDPASRTSLELVVNMQNGWGYFFGGRYSIRRGPAS